MTIDDLGTLTEDGEYTRLTFRRRFAHPIETVWAAIPDPAERSVVRYELTEDGDGTLLTFTHTGLSPTNARGFAPGTHAFLDRLTAHLTESVLPHWSTRYEEVAALYSSWR